MIVRYPTALYESVLPQSPSDSGNVTYTISMEDPPRVFQTTIRLPPAVERREKPDKVLDDDTRRIHLGQRIFTVSRTRKSVAGSGKKQFEVGQVITFGADVESDVNPMLVGDLELRHDTNLLDLSGLGLTSADIAKVGSDAMKRLRELQAQLSQYTRQRGDAEVEINENQKTQNETRKAIAAIEQLAVSNPAFEELLNDLRAKLPVLQSEMEGYVKKANAAAAGADATRDKIYDLIQVVR